MDFLDDGTSKLCYIWQKNMHLVCQSTWDVTMLELFDFNPKRLHNARHYVSQKSLSLSVKHCGGSTRLLLYFLSTGALVKVQGLQVKVSLCILGSFPVTQSPSLYKFN